MRTGNILFHLNAGTKYFLVTQSSFTRSLSQVQNIIKKQALSIEYLEERPLSNEQWSQEHDLFLLRFYYPSKIFFSSSKHFNVFYVDNLRVFRDAGEKGRKVRKFPTWDVSRASVDASSGTVQ